MIMRLEIMWIVSMIVRLESVSGVLMLVPVFARSVFVRMRVLMEVHAHARAHVRAHASRRRVDARDDGCAHASGCGYDDVRGLHPSRVSLETSVLSAEYAMKRDGSGVATTWLAATAIGYSAMDR